MDFWKDLPNVSGILLTLIGTAMIFLSETSKWLEERKKTRLGLAMVFVVLGITGIVAGRIERKRTEKEEILADERQRQLAADVAAANQALAEDRQMLLESKLAQEHMKGQLEGIGLIAGKIGQGTDEHMKQLVGAINKMADTGTVHALTNKQLCDRAMSWAKRVRESEAKFNSSSSSFTEWQQQVKEMNEAKTQEEKQVVWNRYTLASIQRYQQHDLEFKGQFLGEGIYLRDEITKRLPSVPTPPGMSLSMFSGVTNTFIIQDGTNYLEQLARTLCPE